MTLFVPNCLRKRACATGVSYSGYTITDYLTLCEVPIFAASSKLAPQEKTGYAANQHSLFFSVGLKQPSRGEWNPRIVKIN